VKKSELIDLLKKMTRQITPADFAFARKYLEEDMKEVPDGLRRKWIEAILSYLFQNLKDLAKLREDSIEDEEIDENSYKEIIQRIRNNSKSSKSEAEHFRKIAEAVIPYLIFIARKPVHPPETKFPGGLKIRKIERRYLCPVKSKQMNSYSFCEFCPCDKMDSHSW